MEPALLVTVLLVFCMLSSHANYLKGTLDQELAIMKDRVRVVYDLLETECPSNKTKREPLLPVHPSHFEIESQLYQRLFKKLIECRKRNLLKTMETSTKGILPSAAQPVECLHAVNYTEAWRRDYNGSNFRPGGPNPKGYACDMHANNSEWFRFSGEAGNRILDRCPKEYSCGTWHPFWTDEKAPDGVGLELTLNVYGVYRGRCAAVTRQLKVIRCSRDTEYDFVYKPTDNSPGDCWVAFCGMM